MSKTHPNNTPIALTIAGSDSGGSAGVQADMLTFAAHGVFATAAITATTAQNPNGVNSIETSSPKHLRKQIEQVLDFFAVKAIKIGMLANLELVQCVTETLSNRKVCPPVVLDPVMVSTSGALLLKQEAIDSIQARLIPLATLVTPNLDEAQVLLRRKLATAEDLEFGGAELANRWKVPFLLKGGHLASDDVVDLWQVPGEKPVWFHHPRIPKVDTHGSGCTLSSAIAAHLALGHSPSEAATGGIAYLQRGLKNPLYLNGLPYINHFPPKG